MQSVRLAALTTAGALFIASIAVSQDPGSFGGPDPIDADGAISTFTDEHPGSRLLMHNGRISRVYGKSFSGGPGPVDSAEAFRVSHAAMFGVNPDDLLPIGPTIGGDHIIPLKADPQTGEHQFTSVQYTQFLEGVPVFQSDLRLVVRNEAGFPLVQASSSLRDLGGFQVAPGAAAALDAGALDAQIAALVGGQAEVLRSRPVIFAGAGDATADPALAWEAYIRDGFDEWQLVMDAATGEELYRIFTICFGSAGNVDALVTSGVGSEQCEDELSEPLPYVKVTVDGSSTFTDADGNYLVPVGGGGEGLTTVELDGIWFDVFNFGGPDLSVSLVPKGPGDAQITLNAENDDPLVRSEVNCYAESNEVRDFVIQYVPAYPTLGNQNFTVNVNRTDGFCPGNAWYSPGEVSINFCQEGGNSPNTGWSSVVFHEYGHHLVQAAGSGQGAYGEGMGDCISVLLLDSPLLGLGFFGSCGQALRNADNNCQYQAQGCSSCGSGSHSCGQLLSGCVWDLRNELLAVDPEGYRDTLSALTLSSILLHTGSSINSAITVDFLTLDDDDDDILNGTPHYDQIQTAFSLHGLPGPELAALSFSFPGGLPNEVSPNGGQTIQVIVEGLSAEPEPGTGEFFYRVGGTGAFTSFAMDQTAPNQYTATLPAAECGQQFDFYFSAEATNQQVATSPGGAPTSTYFAFVGTDAPETTFSDDFESDTGWSVTNSAGLTDGQWDLGVPVTNCNRGNPTMDADGSGSCYVTDNSAANGCNSDVDGGFTFLTSPTLDASVPNAYISYYRWFSNTQGDSPFQDVFQVEVSDDNGQTWTELETVGPNGDEVDGGWFFRQFRIDDVVEANDQFRIRFVASDTNPGSVVEAGVDGVSILSIECEEGPTGDLNGDGVVDGADLGELLGGWGSDGPTDLNGDGDTNGADLGILLGAWS